MGGVHRAPQRQHICRVSSVGGGSLFYMSIIRNGNVALVNLRKPHVAMSI